MVATVLDGIIYMMLIGLNRERYGLRGTVWCYLGWLHISEWCSVVWMVLGILNIAGWSE